MYNVSYVKSNTGNPSRNPEDPHTKFRAMFAKISGWFSLPVHDEHPNDQQETYRTMMVSHKQEELPV